MKEFKGTPGPWSMDEYGNIVSGEKNGWGRAELVRVSGVALPGRVTDEYAANSTLVTAAPELLEALQKLRAYVTDVCGVDDEDCHADHPLMSSKAAISKALGETK